MKRLFIIICMLTFSVSLYSLKSTINVQDKDNKEALSKVSVIIYIEGKRKKLGKTDDKGQFLLELQRKYAKNKVMLWKKDYKKKYYTVEEIMTQKDPILLQEKKPPREVTDIKVREIEGKTFLTWKKSESADTEYYTVYYHEGLDPYRKWKDNIKKSQVEIFPLKKERDYFFQIKAIDKNKNKNKGTEFHSYEALPQLKARYFGKIKGILRGLNAYPGKVMLYPLHLGDSVNVDASPIDVPCDKEGVYSLDKIPVGKYTLKAWADINGNGAWDGNWLGGQAEPRVTSYNVIIEIKQTLKMDITLDTRSTSVPRIIYDEQPGYVELYNAAWNMARAKITPGKTENGFVNAYMDEGFNNHIYQWDTCFMMFFGIYGGDDFPAMNSLDNFYVKQRPNGYICRVQNEDTGGDYDPTMSDPSVNPPLYAWIEWTYFRITGDNSRLLWALTHLDKYYKWLQNNTRREAGHYFTSNLGSGMDNSPREGMAYGWVDMTAQMALFARNMYNIGRELDIPSLMSFYATEYKVLDELVNNTLWDEDKQIYFDIKKNGKLHKKKTIASFWPLLAKIVPDDRIQKLVDHLRDPNEFKTPHVFPTLAKDEAEYDKKGYYWRGGVWAPTTFMVIKGLEYNGFSDLAYESSLNHIENMWKVYSQFVPDKKRLPYKESNISFPAHLDGTKQIWELYSPELQEAGTRWDNNFYCRPEFVGWSGVGPIVLMIENVLGIIPHAVKGVITWDIRSDKRHGVQGLLYKGYSVDLIMTGIRQGVPQLEIKSEIPFTLKYKYKGKEFTKNIRN